MRNAAWVALLVVVAMTLAACSMTTSTSPRRTVDLDGGARLQIPAGSIQADAVISGGATAAPVDLPSLPGMLVAGSVDITTSAQPTTEVVVDIPVTPESYADSLSANDQSVLVLHKPEGGEWELLEGRLDRQRNVVSVATGSLSPLSVLFLSGAALRRKAADIVDGLFGIDFRTDAPACQQKNATKDAGYSVRSDATDVIRWCLGPGSGDKSQLTLVLNRPYAMVATLGRGLTLGETTGGTFPVALAQAATEALGRQGEVTLSPGGTTTVVVDLPEGGSTRLHAEFDGFAQALVSLQLAAELIAEFATLMRFRGAAAGAEDVLAKIDAAECIPKLQDVAIDPTDGDRLGAMLGACLRPEYFVESTAKVVTVALLGLVGAMGGTIAYLYTSTTAFVDLLSGQSTYDLSITRKKAGIPLEFVGEWTRHVTTLVVSASGDAQIDEGAYVGGCPEISQTEYCTHHYKLTLARAGDGVVGTYTDQWLTLGESSRRYETPSIYAEDSARVGDQVRVSIDAAGQMLFHGIGRLSGITDTPDGQLNNGWQFCSARTKVPNNCGA